MQVNGESLVGVSNTIAMETLRRAMRKGGAGAHYIDIVVARRNMTSLPARAHTPEAREVRVSASSQDDVIGVVMTSREKVDQNANNFIDVNAMEHESSTSSIERHVVTSAAEGRESGSGSGKTVQMVCVCLHLL